MRRSAAHAPYSTAPAGRKTFPISGFTAGLAAVLGTALLFGAAPARAQAVPETLRINVEPPEPGIRSITVDKKYRPIINRDDKGVVIDTQGSDNSRPPCDVKLEVTLENSRVLHRDANICSGGTLVVDVTNDGKPGASARIVGSDSGVVAGPVTKSPEEASRPAAQPSTTTERPNLTEVTPPQSGGLEPLEQVETPISTPSGQETDTAALPNDLETIVRDSISGNGSSEPILVSENEAREWQAEPGSQAGAPTMLQHAVPGSNDRDFRADCGSQSGFARITFQQAPAGLLEGMPQAVRISAGDFEGSYNAFGSSAANGGGVSLPEVTVEMIDPLWEAMIRESALSISVEGLPAYSVSLKGSANPVRLFVATCAEPQQIVADGAFGGEDPGADLSCGELGRVRSVEAVRPGQIVFRNASRQAVEVSWVDYRGGERPYARLDPGQILEQQTYVSHAWTVRGAGGECRGIYVTRTPYREVVIQGAPATGVPGGAGFGTNNGWDNPGGGFDGQPDNGFPAGPTPPAGINGLNQPANQPFQSARANVADYLCTSGIDLNVVFTPDMQAATVSEMGYGAVTLQRQGGANSFYFESQGHVLKGQVQNATWSRPGLRDVFCARR